MLALEPTWRSRLLVSLDDGPISSLPRAQTTNVLAPRVLTHCGTRHGRIGRPERSPQDFMTRCNCQARHGISWAPQLLHTTRLWLTSALDGYPTLEFFCMRLCYAFRSAGMHRSRRYSVRSSRTTLRPGTLRDLPPCASRAAASPQLLQFRSGAHPAAQRRSALAIIASVQCARTRTSPASYHPSRRPPL